MSGLLHLANLELRRLFPRRGWVAVAASTVVLAGVSASAFISRERPAPTSSQAMSVTSVGLIVTVVGVLLFANDQRHGTLVRWVGLFETRRQLLGAKLLAAALAGAILSLIAITVSRTVALFAGLSSEPVVDELALGARSVTALALSATLATAVAVLARGLVAPFIVLLALGPLIESLLTGLEASTSDWLPLSSISSLTATAAGADSPAAATALIVLILWIVGLTALAAVSLDRRDLSPSRR